MKRNGGNELWNLMSGSKEGDVQTDDKFWNVNLSNSDEFSTTAITLCCMISVKAT